MRRTKVAAALFVAALLAGCQSRTEPEWPPRQPAAQKEDVERSLRPVPELVPGISRLDKMREVYDDDVVDYENKYAGKEVLVDLDVPASIARDRRGYYVPQRYGFSGARTHHVNVYLRRGQEQALSDALARRQPIVLRLLVDREGYGFADARLSTPDGVDR